MPEAKPGEFRSCIGDAAREKGTCKGGCLVPPLQVSSSLVTSSLLLLSSPGPVSGTGTVPGGGGDEDGVVGGWVVGQCGGSGELWSSLERLEGCCLGHF